ncbi:MAG TPA: hypothetical protein VF532_16875 [Candidatus Angelobacter sp.]
MFVLPVTFAVNCCVALVATLIVDGLIVTATGVGAGVGVGVGIGVGVGTGVGVGVGVGGGAVKVTVTDAESDLLLSAWLVAVTVKVPAVLGAVYIPNEVIVPLLADQVTPVLLVPVMLTVNCCCLPTCKGTVCGLTVTATGVELFVPVLPLFALPLAQPPIARMNWREKRIRKADNQLWRLRTLCTFAEFSQDFIGVHFFRWWFLFLLRHNLYRADRAAQIPFVPWYLAEWTCPGITVLT